MNRIANDLMRLASELLPRIMVTFTRTPKIEDRDLHSIHFDIQRFVSTLRKNEGIECFVARRDDDQVMEIVVGFTDHEAMKGILASMTEMLEKLGKKTGVKTKIETIEEK